RHEREHQRAAAPVLPQRHRPCPPQRRGARGRRSGAERPTTKDARLEDTRRGAHRALERRGLTIACYIRTCLTTARLRHPGGGGPTVARGYRRSGPPSGRASTTTAASPQASPTVTFNP